ncbi:RNA-binding protein 4-like isoform X1 [Hydra vulgaris]|uniref:RNA-binding protein 4-like isoform X1 n=2 Tax=Hydra vulgaris TaxID=6087 RepID=A0ABM4DPM6_HYDVU
MPTKVYVGNLPDNCNPDNLRGLFGPYGEVNELTVIKNFAFVHFAREEDANNAVQDLHKSKMLGQQITVEISKSRSKDKKDRSNGGGRENHRENRRDRRDDRRDRGMRRGPQPIGGLNAPLGGILGAAPVEQNILGGLGIFSAVNTLAAAAAAEQQSRQQELNRQDHQRINSHSQPDPDVRVRREVVHSREVPNAGKLGLTDGYVIYERYYVDSNHPLLKGLPIPELPRMTDTYVSGRDSFRSNQRDVYDDFRDRSPIANRRDDYDRERDRSRDYGY